MARFGFASTIPTFLLAAAIAGCLTNGPASTGNPLPTKEVLSPAVPADFKDPLIMAAGHDHTDAHQHDLSYNMELTYHHPLGGNAVKSSGAHAVEIQDNWLFVAAYGAQVDVSGGLYIFDLHKDPEKPPLVGHLN